MIKTHVHNLRPFAFNPTQVNPLDVAQQNEQEFVVDGILAHRGNHHRRSTMEFLVRWAGYDESSNSWEPYKALMHVDKRHDYLRALSRFFPRHFSNRDWFSPSAFSE